MLAPSHYLRGWNRVQGVGEEKMSARRSLSLLPGWSGSEQFFYATYYNGYGVLPKNMGPNVP